MSLNSGDREAIDYLARNTNFSTSFNLQLPPEWEIKDIQNRKLCAFNKVAGFFIKIYPQIEWAKGLYIAQNNLHQEDIGLPKGYNLVFPSELYNQTLVYPFKAEVATPIDEKVEYLIKEQLAKKKYAITPFEFTARRHEAIFNGKDYDIIDFIDDSPGALMGIFKQNIYEP